MKFHICYDIITMLYSDIIADIMFRKINHLKEDIKWQKNLKPWMVTVLPLIAPHFANRYPEENWIIYDERREKFAIHRAGKGWMIVENMQVAEEVKSQLSMEEEDYRAMWRAFTKSIAIEARKNENLQKQLLPLRFRDKMTEFKE